MESLNSILSHFTHTYTLQGSCLETEDQFRGPHPYMFSLALCVLQGRHDLWLNHKIMELEGAYKAIESNPLLNEGIQIKIYLTDGCLGFGALTTTKVIGSIVILL